MQKPYSIVGVLNVTPDSYFDGGKHNSIELALQHASLLVKEGVDIIDVGGESTFVDRNDVSLDEELSRVIPVISAIASENSEVGISVDTYKSQVAIEAVNAGATMVNDVTAGRGDDQMFDAMSKLQADYVMMYAKDETSRTTTDATTYDDVVGTVFEFLQTKIKQASQAGISKDRVIIDPGLGFFISSIPDYSYQLLANLYEFLELECPVYVSPSRKSFLAGKEKLPADQRLPGTIAASVIAVQNGASFVRTHDVEQIKRALEISHAITEFSGW